MISSPLSERSAIGVFAACERAEDPLPELYFHRPKRGNVQSHKADYWRNSIVGPTTDTIAGVTGSPKSC
jgi:hypothetical protein